MKNQESFESFGDIQLQAQKGNSYPFSDRSIEVKRKLINRFLFSVLLFVLSFIAAIGEDQNPLIQKVDELFVDLDNTESPGIAVLVVREGKVLLRKGYGMANLEHKAPITPDTVFDIASVSKQFTGMAISMLIEEGKEKNLFKVVQKVVLQDKDHLIV